MANPIRVLIATPCAMGMVTTHYLLSFIKTRDEVLKDPKQFIEMGLYALANESLISRGRAHCAAVAMYNGWDKLMFIDADQSWKPEHFKALVNSDKPIIGCVSPLKILPIHLNYQPTPDDEKYHPDGYKSVKNLKAMRDGHGTPEIKVNYIGTGMLCIDVKKCLIPMSEIAAPFRYPNPDTGKNQTHWNFFDTTPIRKECMSEDWGFIHKARSIGIDPYINADCIIEHTGALTFRAEMSA